MFHVKRVPGLRSPSAMPFPLPVMTRADFNIWRTAYDNFVKCGQSDAAVKSCIDGWSRDDAKFIDDAHRGYVRDAAGYYLETRLRSSPQEQQKYCKPLKT